jgi:hypothetical protein
MTNKMVSSATPGLSDIFRQSPDLMNSFMKATVDSLNNTGPAGGSAGGAKPHPLASFAQDMFSKDFKPSTTQGPPPAPVETKVNKGQPLPPQQTMRAGSNMQFTSRPDLQQARSGGIEINQGYSSLREPSRPMMTEPISNFSPPVRQEMKGPSSTDLDSLLAGLKIKETSPIHNEVVVDDETVSVISMRDMESTASGNKGYKKRGASKRKPRSDKSVNNISIDL